MRICFVAHAGSANTRSWANHFADVLGHDVHVVSLFPGDGLSGTITLHVMRSRWSSAPAYLRALLQVRRLVRRIAPDIVVGYRTISYGFLAAVTGFHPLAVAAQGQVVSPPLGALKLMLAGFTLGRADLVNSWGPHMTRRLVEVGAAPEKILTCPRGIDLDLFRRRNGDAPRTENVIVTRTMHRVYRHDVILRALSLLSKERPGLRGVFVGDGEARSELEKLSTDLGMDGLVDFHGAIRPDRLAELLRGASVYVSAVKTDGVSASLLEAMACGCYPVVTDNEANRLWVDDGENGTLVAGSEPADLARAIAGALDDVEARDRAAALNRRIVEERADLTKNMRTIEDAYESLVASASGGPPAASRTGGSE